MRDPTAADLGVRSMVRKGAGGTKDNAMTMVGIDVSKASLAVTVLPSQTRRPTWQGSVPNTPAGIRRLLAHTPPEAPWVVEPTGRYGHLVVQAGWAAARRVLQAPPKQAKYFLAAVHSRAKTDRVDSHGLALYGLSAMLRPYRLKEPRVDRVDQVLAVRANLTRSLARLKQQATELPATAALLQPAIDALRAQRQACDRELQAQTRDTDAFPAVAALQAIPGVGLVTAVALATRLQTIPFKNEEAFTAYVGLDVRVRQSGRRKGQQMLTRQGDAERRRLLYLCAQASLRAKGSPFRAQYERERAKGLPTTAALCAVARKLAAVSWSLVQHRTTYDPARVYHRPQQSLDTEP